MPDDLTSTSVRASPEAVDAEPKSLDATATGKGAALKVVLVVWMLAYTTAALVLIIEGWLRNYGLLRQAFCIPSDQELSALLVAAFHSILGGILGAGALGMVSFHKHISIKQVFNNAHAWGYLFAPWLAAVLGLIVFALLQAGLLVFSGTALSSEKSDTAPLGYLAIGFLSGFGWYQATQRIRRLIKKFFAEPTQPTETPSPPVPLDGVGETTSSGPTPDTDQSMRDLARRGTPH